jgi:hypothetical protein
MFLILATLISFVEVRRSYTTYQLPGGIFPFTLDNPVYHPSIDEATHTEVVVCWCRLVRMATLWRGMTGAATRSPPVASGHNFVVGLSAVMQAADGMTAA